MPNVEDNTLHDASNKETDDVLDKIDCFQKDTCTRCDESGDLLVCTEPGCPIALHELCMSCEPSFDEDGRFYCPYCSYKRALIRVNELRRKTMVAKRALSDFIDTRMVGGDNSPRMGEAGKKKSDDVSTCGGDVNLPNHGSHLCNESSRDHDIQVEQNQSNEGEDRARAGGDVEPTSMVGVNSEIHDGPIVSNVSNSSHSAPTVQPCEDRMDEETHEAETSGTHQVESLEDKEDGITMDKEILRPIDDIQDDRIAMDHGQLETPGAYHYGEATAQELQEKDGGREQIQPDNEKMLENIVPASGNNDLKNKTTVKKRRFKTKANRRTDLQNVNSPRKSLRLQTPEEKKSPRIRTPEPRRKSPHIQTPEPRKNSPRLQTPKPQKDNTIKIEKVSVSRNLKPQPASHNQL